MNKNVLEAGEYGNPVTFHWFLVDHCQWKCSYCNATQHMQEELYKRGQHQKSYELVLHRLARMNFDFRIDILGGEPTLHKQLPAVIHALENIDHCKEIILTTNFTESIEYFKQFDRENSKLEIHISYHAEYHKKILPKILRLHDEIKHAAVFVEVMLYPKQEYFQQLLELLAGLEEKSVVFGVNLVKETAHWKHTPDPDFYQTFEKWITGKHYTPYDKPIEHITPEGIEYLHENELIRNSFSYTGYHCQQLTYTIDVAGTFHNLCTKEKMSLTAKEQDFKKIIVCPIKNTCPCSEQFYNKKIRYVNLA